MLIDFRERRQEGERVGEKYGMGGVFVYPKWGPNLQPGDVPQLGIEPSTSMERCSNQVSHTVQSSQFCFN